MRKFLLSILLVTTAAVPSVAQAQREDFAKRSGERAVGRGDRSESEWRSQRAQRTAPPQQVQMQQPAREAPPQAAERRNWQSRGQDSMATATPERPRSNRSGGDWTNQGDRRSAEYRRESEQRRYGWNRNNNGQAVTPPATTQHPRRTWNGDQRERWSDRSRTEDRRHDGNRDRWDNNDRRDRNGRRYAYRTPDNNEWHNRSWYDDNDRHQRWNNDWRRDRRYDWRNYRSHNRDYYRLPRYAHPYGYNYGYRRFSIGIFLDNLFFSDRYWINDPWEYRLPPAYGPYRWVRYYDDVLLVDLRNGRVVDVIYSFFW